MPNFSDIDRYKLIICLVSSYGLCTQGDGWMDERVNCRFLQRPNRHAAGKDHSNGVNGFCGEDKNGTRTFLGHFQHMLVVKFEPHCFNCLP